MKLLEHTTVDPVETTLRAVSHWRARLHQLHQRLRPHFARPEPHQHALLYLQAVLSEIPRKNGWQIAEHARQERPYGIERLLSRASWDQDGVRDELRALVGQMLTPPPLESEHSEACGPLLSGLFLGSLPSSFSGKTSRSFPYRSFDSFSLLWSP